jgi:simple sugar transport system permease protein
MWSDLLQAAFVVSLIRGMFRIGTPILMSALGELVAERAGVLNLGLEGIMAMGALAGFAVAFYTGELWLGIVAALLAGGVLGLLMAFLVVTLQSDQIIAGLTLNLLAAGISLYIFRVAFADYASQSVPSIRTFTELRLPFLADLPVVGRALFSNDLLTYLVILFVPILAFFLYRTRPGLVLRSVGENPRAVDMRGVNVVRYQYLAVTFGAMMAGLGGAFLSLASAGLFVPGIVAGRGWIAVAIVILGNWRPASILAGALFFGLIESFQLQVQGVGISFPHQLLVMLPYLLTIIALVIGRHKAGAPAALGVAYSRE